MLPISISRLGRLRVLAGLRFDSQDRAVRRPQILLRSFLDQRWSDLPELGFDVVDPLRIVIEQGEAGEHVGAPESIELADLIVKI